MPVKLNGSTSGFVELKSPAVAGTTSLELPTDSIKPGLVLVNETTFSAAASVSINNCFSSTYAFYRIHWDLVNGSGSYDISMRLRTGGTDNSGAVYGRQSLYFYGTTVGTDYNDTQTAFASVSTADTSGGSASIDVFNPFASSVTRMTSVSGRNGSGKVGFFLGGAFSADGFTFYPTTGTVTGTVRVYGLRNSL